MNLAVAGKVDCCVLCIYKNHEVEQTR